MSSASAMAPCAILPVYGSTKSFVRQLSDSLGRSYPANEHGVVFHEFHPQFVRTPMTTEGPETIDVTGILQKFVFPDVDEWVNSALKVNHGRSWPDQNGPQRLKTYFTHIKIEYLIFSFAIN